MGKTTSSSSPSKELPVDYDGNWKDFFHVFLRDFLRLRFPGIYRAIDWSKPPEFLEQELRLALKKKLKGKKISDLLVKVWLKNGEQKYLYIHLEVQSYFDSQVPKRVLEYHSLICINLEIEEVTSLVLFTGSDVPRNRNRYEKNILGTWLGFKFPCLVVREEDEKKLLRSRNPAALALLANLYVLRTKGNPKQRAIFKEAIFKRLDELKIPSKMFLDLFNFVKDLMSLPKRFENKVMKKVLAPEFTSDPWSRLPKSKTQRMLVLDFICRHETGIRPSLLTKQLEEMEAKAQKAEQAKMEAQKAKMEAKMEAQKMKVAIRKLAKDMDWNAEEIASK
ncbi:MAG: Rpn family recombination-promoting nuclease/putative transposase, partial [Bacteroidota bacterium]